MTYNRILRRPELLALLGISRSTLYQMMAENRFPRPIRLSKRAVGWKSQLIAEWLANRDLAVGGV